MDKGFSSVTIPTAIGDFSAVFTQKGLGRLLFPSESREGCDVWLKKHIPGAEPTDFTDKADLLRQELNDYFAKKLHTFTTPLDMRGTVFQTRVWDALLRIPYGETRSYMQIAEMIENPRAVRAVGMANHANPVPIIVPCHRVIGKDGGLTGYGGGLELKRRLLAIEGRWL